MGFRQIYPRTGSAQRRRLPLVRLGGVPRMTVATGTSTHVLVDLSHAGCVVQSRTPFQPGDEHYLTFVLDQCLSFVVPVRVVQSRPSRRSRPAAPRYLTGFEFVLEKQPDLHRVIEILLEASQTPLAVH